MPSQVVSESRWSQVRPLIVSALQEVSSIGLVLDRKRWGGDLNHRDNDFIKHYIVPGLGRINTWLVHRAALERSFRTGREYQANHLIQFEGFYQMDDRGDSESAFQDICDDVVTHFQGKIRLGDTNNRILLQGPLVIEEIDHRWMGKYLTHHCLATVVVQQRVLQPTFS